MQDIKKYEEFHRQYAKREELYSVDRAIQKAAANAFSLAFSIIEDRMGFNHNQKMKRGEENNVDQEN